MATTHDMRYESQKNERDDTRRSNWSWLLPLALLLLGAIALASYLANRDDTTIPAGTNGANTELNSGLNTQSTEVLPY
jgi:hypothetical protein